MPPRPEFLNVVRTKLEAQRDAGKQFLCLKWRVNSLLATRNSAIRPRRFAVRFWQRSQGSLQGGRARGTPLRSHGPQEVVDTDGHDTLVTRPFQTGIPVHCTMDRRATPVPFRGERRVFELERFFVLKVGAGRAILGAQRRTLPIAGENHDDVSHERFIRNRFRRRCWPCCL